jgi:hypothetical protein
LRPTANVRRVGSCKIRFGLEVAMVRGFISVKEAGRQRPRMCV